MMALMRPSFFHPKFSTKLKVPSKPSFFHCLFQSTVTVCNIAPLSAARPSGSNRYEEEEESSDDDDEIGKSSKYRVNNLSDIGYICTLRALMLYGAPEQKWGIGCYNEGLVDDLMKKARQSRHLLKYGRIGLYMPVLIPFQLHEDLDYGKQ